MGLAYHAAVARDQDRTALLGRLSFLTMLARRGRCPSQPSRRGARGRTDVGVLDGGAGIVASGRPRADPFSWRLAQGSRGHPGEDSFISTIPATISAAATTRAALSCSPRAAVPTTNDPTAPMPVHVM